MEASKNKIDLNKVLKFAKKMHKGQYRADKKTPYIEHPKRVAEIIKTYKHTSKNMEDLIACALLHDVLEDTYCSYRELVDKFGVVVASMVMEVTTAGYVPKLIGKDNYLKSKMLNMTSYALDIKLADRLDNITDLNGIEIERRNIILKQTRNIIDALKNERTLTQTQIKLIEAIENELQKYEI